VNAPIYFPPVQEHSGLPSSAGDVLSAEELERIDADAQDLTFEQPQLGRQLGYQAGMVSYRASGHIPQRDSLVAYPTGPRWIWLYEALHVLMQMFNARYYRFKLWGFHEVFQLLEYREGGQFGWHIDVGPPLAAPRKLSFTLQLSDPSDYDGGDLELWGNERHTAPRERGTLIVFPSYTLHRVTPVTRGRRRALVGGAVGEPFR